MSKITYTDKVAIYENTKVPDINKVNADDMNEIKSVVNANDDTANNLKIIALNNEWLNAIKSLGNALSIMMPIYNPNSKLPTINFTSAQIYYNDAWENISAVYVQYYGKTFVTLELRNSLNLTNGYCYLVRFVGSINCN